MPGGQVLQAFLHQGGKPLFVSGSHYRAQTLDGLFDGLANLRCIQFLGHGVADVLRHPDLPAGVPVTRLKDPGIIRWMVEHCVGYILPHRRHIAAHNGGDITAPAFS